MIRIIGSDKQEISIEKEKLELSTVFRDLFQCCKNTEEVDVQCSANEFVQYLGLYGLCYDLLKVKSDYKLCDFVVQNVKYFEKHEETFNEFLDFFDFEFCERIADVILVRILVEKDHL